MNRYTDEMKLWLFDVAHGNLNENEILSGFIKHYVLFNCTMQDIQSDILFRTHYGNIGIVTAMTSIKNVLIKSAI